MDAADFEVAGLYDPVSGGASTRASLLGRMAPWGPNGAERRHTAQHRPPKNLSFSAPASGSSPPPRISKVPDTTHLSIACPDRSHFTPSYVAASVPSFRRTSIAIRGRSPD